MNDSPLGFSQKATGVGNSQVIKVLPVVRVFAREVRKDILFYPIQVLGIGPPNLQVLIFNQRSIQEILDVIVDLGSLVHCEQQAAKLVSDYTARIDAAYERGQRREHRPRVYFEEWDDPMICGIQWVSELIEIAGGQDIFAERSRGKLAKERFVDEAMVRDLDPELMLASWCGKALDEASVYARKTMGEVTALRDRQLIEVPPEIILQPGPACLTDGLDRLEEIISCGKIEPGTHMSSGEIAR